MPIQIVIFLTKSKLFAAEVNNDGKADTISVKGNPDIKCDDATDVDELLECLFDAFSIDSFADDNFDIVIVDCGGDKKIVSYLNAKCADAAKLSIIGMEKLLPLIVWNKTQLQAGEELVVAFGEACYKVACDEHNVLRVKGKALEGKDNITLDLDDFGCLFHFKVENLQGGVVDVTVFQEKDNVIAKLEEENDKLVRSLKEKGIALAAALATAEKAEKKNEKLNAEIKKWQKNHPKPTKASLKMLKIIEESKKALDSYESNYWSFYTKNVISKNKLNGTVKVLSEMIKDKIVLEEILALFLSNIKDDTNIILLTEKGIYFDGARTLIDNCWQLPKPGYLAWADINTVKHCGTFGNDIEINVFGQASRRFIFFATGFDNAAAELVNMINKLKDVDT